LQRWPPRRQPNPLAGGGTVITFPALLAAGRRRPNVAHAALAQLLLPPWPSGATFGARAGVWACAVPAVGGIPARALVLRGDAPSSLVPWLICSL
jgi:hypothetical protein